MTMTKMMKMDHNWGWRCKQLTMAMRMSDAFIVTEKVLTSKGLGKEYCKSVILQKFWHPKFLAKNIAKVLTSKGLGKEYCKSLILQKSWHPKVLTKVLYCKSLDIQRSWQKSYIAKVLTCKGLGKKSCKSLRLQKSWHPKVLTKSHLLSCNGARLLKLNSNVAVWRGRLDYLCQTCHV